MSRLIKFVNSTKTVLTPEESRIFAALEKSSQESSVYVVKYYNQTSKMFIKINYSMYDGHLMFEVKLVPTNYGIAQCLKAESLLRFGIFKAELVGSYANHIINTIINSRYFSACPFIESDFPILFPTLDDSKEMSDRKKFIDRAHRPLILEVMNNYAHLSFPERERMLQRYYNMFEQRLNGVIQHLSYTVEVSNGQLADYLLKKKVEVSLVTTIIEIIGNKMLEEYPAYHPAPGNLLFTKVKSSTVRELRAFHRTNFGSFLFGGIILLDNDKNVPFVNNYAIEIESPCLSPDDIVTDAFVIFGGNEFSFPVMQQELFNVSNAIDHLRSVSRLQKIEQANDHFEKMNFRPRDKAENIKNISAALRCMNYTQHSILICQDPTCKHSSLLRREFDCPRFKIEFFCESLIEKDEITFSELLAYSRDVVIAVHHGRAMAI